MNNAKPILPTNCVSPTEFSVSDINGREISDIHTDNSCPSNERIIEQNVSEYCIPHDQSIKLQKNMDISSDALHQGRVAKLMRHNPILAELGRLN